MVNPNCWPTSARPAAAIAAAVLLITLTWSFRIGAWALLLIPVMALYVVNVHLGGGLNDSPLDGIARLRNRRSDASEPRK